jgi:hypothetical protein
MDAFAKVMNSWEEVLNKDKELEERNESFYSTIEGKTAIQLEVEKKPAYRVEVKGGKFKVQPGSGKNPLLNWKVSLDLFKDVMLGRYRLVYGLLDPRGEVSFHTEHFTHWNGATIIEMLFLAQELISKHEEISKLVKDLGE